MWNANADVLCHFLTRFLKVYYRNKIGRIHPTAHTLNAIVDDHVRQAA